MNRSLLILIILFPAVVPADTPALAGAAEKITYDNQVRPIFREKCFACHNSNKKTADLDLSTYTGLMAGGSSGTVIEPPSADGSYLFGNLPESSTWIVAWWIAKSWASNALQRTSRAAASAPVQDPAWQERETSLAPMVQT